jgi:hypothetical protein
LWKHTSQSSHPIRLVAVAEVGQQSEKFYAAVQEELFANEVHLYRFDQLGPLVQDIKSNATLHSA